MFVCNNSRLKADIDRIKLESEETIQQIKFKHSSEIKVIINMYV